MAKKDPYFTTLTIDQKASELYQQLRELFRDRNLPYHPQVSALLVLDMQEYFLNPASHAYIPSAAAIVDRVVWLIDAYAHHGWPIIFTQQINTASDAGMMSSWWKDLITSENAFHRIIPEIDVTKGHLIQKSQYDAFYQTRLDEILRAAGVRQVIICGVMTHLCCETTARSAFMHGYEVFFPVDGTATYNLEFHQATLVNLAHGFATLVRIKDLLEAIRGEHGS